MEKTPTAKDMIELPGPFLFKVFVKPSLLDGGRLLELSKDCLGRDLGNPELTFNTSKKGNYVSYSFTLHIEVYEEIERLYSVFQKTEGVVYVL